MMDWQGGSTNDRKQIEYQAHLFHMAELCLSLGQLCMQAARLGLCCLSCNLHPCLSLEQLLGLFGQKFLGLFLLPDGFGALLSEDAHGQDLVWGRGMEVQSHVNR